MNFQPVERIRAVSKQALNVSHSARMYQVLFPTIIYKGFPDNKCVSINSQTICWTDLTGDFLIKWQNIISNYFAKRRNIEYYRFNFTPILNLCVPEPYFHSYAH